MGLGRGVCSPPAAPACWPPVLLCRWCDRRDPDGPQDFSENDQAPAGEVNEASRYVLDLSCRRVRSPACCSLARVSGWRMWTGTALAHRYPNLFTNLESNSEQKTVLDETPQGEGEEGRACLGWD